MILTKNIVTEDGQTIFSGTRVVPHVASGFIMDGAGGGYEEEYYIDGLTFKDTKRMTWLHDHQIALRLALETGDTTPHWGTNRHILDIQGNNGCNKPISTHDQIIPVSQ